MMPIKLPRMVQPRFHDLHILMLLCILGAGISSCGLPADYLIPNPVTWDTTAEFDVTLDGNSGVYLFYRIVQADSTTTLDSVIASETSKWASYTGGTSSPVTYAAKLSPVYSNAVLGVGGETNETNENATILIQSPGSSTKNPYTFTDLSGTGDSAEYRFTFSENSSGLTITNYYDTGEAYQVYRYNFDSDIDAASFLKANIVSGDTDTTLSDDGGDYYLLMVAVTSSFNDSTFTDTFSSPSVFQGHLDLE